VTIDARAADNRGQSVANVGVSVETQNRIRLGEIRRKLLAVALSHTSDSYDSFDSSLGLEIVRREQSVNRILFRCIDETARVNHDGVCGLGII
jgi:hypothetical protein